MDIEKCIGVHPLRRRQGDYRQRQQWEKLYGDLNQYDMFGELLSSFCGFIGCQEAQSEMMLQINAKARLGTPCYCVLFNHLIIDSLISLTMQQIFLFILRERRTFLMGLSREMLFLILLVGL